MSYPDTAEDAIVGGGPRFGRDHVPGRAGRRDRPVELYAGRRVGEIPHLQHLVGQLVEGVPAPFRCAARVRRASGHREQHRADAGRGEGEPVGGSPTLAREDGIVGRAQLRDQAPRTGGAHLFIAVDQDRDQLVVVEVERPQHGERVQDERDTALVVRNPEPVRAPVRDSERLLGKLPAQVDGVHVGEQQDAAAAAAAKAGHHALPYFLRGVDHHVGVVVAHQARRRHPARGAVRR